MLRLVIAALILMSGFTFFTASAEAAKRIEVNLTQQRLYAYDGDTLIYNFLISSGKVFPTPQGTFYPWIKLRSTRMAGGSRSLGTYYNLANVPNVVYFYKGYALHGTYWHSNFGRPMSHGCVNLSIPDSAKIYDWIEMSTPIKIYGTAPR